MPKLIHAAAAALALAVAAPTAPALAADAETGAKIYRKKCKACHTVDEGGKKKVGPNLWAIYGAEAGKKEGFKYSKAMATFEAKWDDETLDAFLKKPRNVVKRTRMAFAGLKKDTDRAAVIAYLKTLQN